jgi:hypothetical protein
MRSGRSVPVRFAEIGQIPASDSKAPDRVVKSSSSGSDRSTSRMFNA